MITEKFNTTTFNNHDNENTSNQSQNVSEQSQSIANQSQNIKISKPTSIISVQPNINIHQFDQPNTLLINDREHITNNNHYVKYPKCMGIIIFSLGITTIILDPLVPILVGYYFTVFFAGILMIVSGMWSVLAINKNKPGLLISSIILEVMACINLCIGSIVGLLVVLDVLRGRGYLSINDIII